MNSMNNTNDMNYNQNIKMNMNIPNMTGQNSNISIQG